MRENDFECFASTGVKTPIAKRTTVRPSVRQFKILKICPPSPTCQPKIKTTVANVEELTQPPKTC